MPRLAVLFAVLLSAGVVAAASAASSSVVVSQCGELGKARPSSFLIACSDAGERATGLHWSHWGASAATARGTLHIKTCVPDCATGGMRTETGTLRLSSRRTCPGRSHRYYRHLTVIHHSGRRESLPLICPR